MNGPRSLTVRVEPSGIELQVEPGEAIMAAAERHGYLWPTLCHGQATCTSCWIELDDPDDFAPPSSVELEGLKLFEGRSFFDDKNVRLGCQACPVKDATVTRRGVRTP